MKYILDMESARSNMQSAEMTAEAFSRHKPLSDLCYKPVPVCNETQDTGFYRRLLQLLAPFDCGTQCHGESSKLRSGLNKINRGFFS